MLGTCMPPVKPAARAEKGRIDGTPFGQSRSDDPIEAQARQRELSER